MGERLNDALDEVRNKLNLERVTADGSIVGREERELFVDLTSAEVLQRGQELAHAHMTLRDHELRLAAVKSEFKGERDRLDATIGKLTDAITQGKEPRMVDVLLVRDDVDRRRISVMRSDTGQVIERRTMSDAEMQERLPGIG